MPGHLLQLARLLPCRQFCSQICAPKHQLAQLKVLEDMGPFNNNNNNSNNNNNETKPEKLPVATFARQYLSKHFL